MKKQYIIFAFISIAIYISSCGNKNVDSRIKYQSISNHSQTSFEAADSSVRLSSIINIEDWVANDSVLLCRSNNTSNIFYRFNLKTLNITDSFGTMGHGPDEYIMPRIVKSDNKNIILADIASNKFIAGDQQSSFLSNDHCLNSPLDIKYPIIGFTELKRNEHILYVCNIESGDIIDSISFTNTGRHSPDIPLNYKAASNGNFLVVAQQFYDELTIIQLNNNFKFKHIICHQGSDIKSQIKPYYVDIVCDSDRFYVLSMKDVVFNENKDPDGTCTIEVFDYNATIISTINLKIFPRKILLDSTNDRLLILSATDDDIHILDLQH